MVREGRKGEQSVADLRKGEENVPFSDPNTGLHEVMCGFLK